MPDETDITIEQHLASLPQYVKDAFKAAKPFEKIRQIGVDFKMHLDENEKLEQEVLLVMLGLESPDTFIDDTSKTFGLSDEDSKKLVDRISAELFVPIRDAMQRYMEELAGGEETTEDTKPPAEEPVGFTLTPNPSKIASLTPQAPTAPVVPIEKVAVITPITPAGAVQPVAPKLDMTVTPAGDALTKPQISPAQKVDVGISPTKPSYKLDPYLEPPV